MLLGQWYPVNSVASDFTGRFSSISATLPAAPYESLEDDPEGDPFEFPTEDAPYVS